MASRRFRNLILDSPFAGSKWLRYVDLSRQLFDNTATPPSTIGDGSESAVVQDSTSGTLAADSRSRKNKQAEVAALNMERIRLSRPIFRFQATADAYCCAIDCFPLSDSKVVIADQTGRTILCDAETRRVVPMPNLHKHKSEPISLFVPSADADDHPSSGGSLYVMERNPNPEKGDSAQLSNQFETFVCSKPTGTSEGMWHCQLLPPPPFVRDPAYWFTDRKIRSYAVVGNNICISTELNGTYCFDMASNTWEVGKRVLPFYGKVEYVPELKLWFGLSTEAGPLAAADLSIMDSQPQLVGDWKEFQPPEGWLDCHDSRLVNLGSGRFCIARLFETMSVKDDERRAVIVVFTGVEVTPVVHNGSCSGSGNGKVKLQMKKHKSRYHMCNNTIIRDVF